MSITLVANPDGTSGSLQVGGLSAITVSTVGGIGVPSAPTATLGTDSTQIATTAFVHDAVAGISPIAPGSAPIYVCRAWVNFNGTGLIAIRASGNVSSITDNGTANYKVNFTTAMTDANFAAVVSSHHNLTASTDSYTWVSPTGTQTTSSVTVAAAYPYADYSYVSVAIFR